MTNKPLRLGLLAFAVLLFGVAGWVLLGESYRMNWGRTQRDQATPLSAESVGSGRTARLAAIRGDLWARRALSITEFTGTALSRSFVVASTKQAEEAREAAEHAVSYAPYDAKMWLLLAQLSSEGGKANPAELLKMAYYTGPTETELVPLRLTLSLKSPAFEDPDVQELIRQDLRKIARDEQHKRSLDSIYRAASPSAKLFLTSALKDIDPAFAGRLSE